MTSTAHCAVINGTVSAKGSKATMIKLVLAARKAGHDAFLGNSQRLQIGQQWGA